MRFNKGDRVVTTEDMTFKCFLGFNGEPWIIKAGSHAVVVAADRKCFQVVFENPYTKPTNGTGDFFSIPQFSQRFEVVGTVYDALKSVYDEATELRGYMDFQDTLNTADKYSLESLNKFKAIKVLARRYSGVWLEMLEGEV